MKLPTGFAGSREVFLQRLKEKINVHSKLLFPLSVTLFPLVLGSRRAEFGQLFRQTEYLVRQIFLI